MERVKHPDHYAGNGLDCWTAQRSMLHEAEKYLSPQHVHLWASAFEYVWRAPKKNGIEDFRKAANLLNKIADELEDDGD